MPRVLLEDGRCRDVIACTSYRRADEAVRQEIADGVARATARLAVFVSSFFSGRFTVAGVPVRKIVKKGQEKECAPANDEANPVDLI